MLCPSCNQELVRMGTNLYQCLKCRYQAREEREGISLYAPSPFGDGGFEMKTVDEIFGYIVYFKEGEPKMLGKEAHVHIKGQGREIQFFLSPFRLKNKRPKNFPKNEESKIYQEIKKKRYEYLAKWEEVKNN